MAPTFLIEAIMHAEFYDYKSRAQSSEMKSTNQAETHSSSMWDFIVKWISNAFWRGSESKRQSLIESSGKDHGYGNVFDEEKGHEGHEAVDFPENTTNTKDGEESRSTRSNFDRKSVSKTRKIEISNVGELEETRIDWDRNYHLFQGSYTYGPTFRSVDWILL